MNNKVIRSALAVLELLILGGLIAPALAMNEGGTGGQGVEPQPPAQYARPGMQAPPGRGPYGGPAMMDDPRMRGGRYGGRDMMDDPGRMGGPYGGPGMMDEPGMTGGPYGGRDMMDDPRMRGGPYGGPGMMDEPGMMGGPYGGPGMMDDPRMRGGRYGGRDMMDDPGMMGGPYGGPGMMDDPRMRGGRYGGRDMMDEPGMMRSPEGGPGRMAGPRARPAETGEGPAGMEAPAMTAAPGGGPSGMDSSRGGPSTISAPGTTGGLATAMLDVISQLDLTEEQRGELDAIREDHDKREKELVEKINVAAERLQKLQQEHMEADQALSDLNGHLATANMDAANRAEELLTAEQRLRLIRGDAHVRMPRQQAQ